MPFGHLPPPGLTPPKRLIEGRGVEMCIIKGRSFPNAWEDLPFILIFYNFKNNHCVRGRFLIHPPSSDSFGMTVHSVVAGEEVAIRKLIFVLNQNFSANRHLFPYLPHIQPVIPSKVRNLTPHLRIIFN